MTAMQRIEALERKVAELERQLSVSNPYLAQTLFMQTIPVYPPQMPDVTCGRPIGDGSVWGEDCAEAIKVGGTD